MTKSADREQASPSSSPPAYVFEGPALVAIRTRTTDQPKYAESEISCKFPWTRQEVVTIVSTWTKSRESIIFFRTFYRCALGRGILGFDKETYLALKEIKTNRVDPYERIFLSQSGLALNEEIRLLKRIERDLSSDSWEEFQLNIILHLGFELAPRSI